MFRNLSSWWSPRQATPTRTARRGVRPPSFRPHLEILEDRLVPAALTLKVTTTADVVDAADGKLSLREAITRANTNPGLDTIKLPAGAFNIGLAGLEDANLSGDFDVMDSVRIQGAGAGATAVDARNLDRVFHVFGTAPSAAIAVTFKGLTIRNGSANNNGGGILAANANLVVKDSVVTRNHASFLGGGIFGTNISLARSIVIRNGAGLEGGGIYTVGPSSTVTLNNCTVRGNSTGELGGGILTATATLTNCTVSGNLSAQSGGGIHVRFSATLTNCTVSGNSALGGGGIQASTATLTNCTVSGNSGGGIAAATATLVKCTVSGNSSLFSGGGISAVTATLTNCTVSGNSASQGGGISASVTLINSTVSGNTANGGEGSVTDRGDGGGIQGGGTMINSTISGNSAGGDGGGIHGTVTLLNVTITENVAQGEGGGVFGGAELKNTIIARNLAAYSTDGSSGTDVKGDFTSQGHNFIGDAAGSTGFGTAGDQVGTFNDPIDPKLGPLQKNGGRTLTHALLRGSRAIDHGDNSGIPATDQRGRGFRRQLDGGGTRSKIVDIGAFERQARG